MSMLDPRNIKLPEGAFDFVGPDKEGQEVIARPSVSYWQDALRRIMRNKTAVFCLVILSIIILGAILIPLFWPYSMSEQHVEYASKGIGFVNPSDGHVFLFGTDTLGRDLFVRVWHGARTSMLIAFSTVLINFFIGVIYGGISGYVGGFVDNVMMRITEIINGIPYLIIVILLMMVMKPGVGTIILALALVSWTGMARLVRGQIIALKEQEFVLAAKAMGASPARIIARYLLPNLLSVVIISVTLQIPGAIFSEAFLSFIGLGVPIPEASWGTLANDGVRVFQQYPSQLFIPSFFISITMLAFNLLGDALRDAFDPKLRN